MKISTVELIGKLYAEPKEVKSSVGGTKEFRSVMDFVLFNSSYDDQNTCEVIYRTETEIAALLEQNFSKETLENIKSIYEN